MATIDLRVFEATQTSEWPKRAAELLLGIVQDDDASDSDLRRAARLACRLPRIDREVDALLAIVTTADSPKHFLAKVTVMFGPILEAGYHEGSDFDDVPVTKSTFDEVQNVVEQFYFASNAPAEVRRRALEASVHAPRDWHAEAVRAAYSSDADAWRLAGVFCMYYIEGFEKEILEALDDPNPLIRANAMRAAGAWELEGAWPHVLAALTDARETHNSIVLAAINALPQIRPEATPELLAGLVSSDDEEIARAADDSLAFVLWPLANYDFGEDPRPH